MRLTALLPLHLRRASGDLHLTTGEVFELLDQDAVRLLGKAPDAVRPVIQVGDTVEWLSPALPAQRAEVLAVHDDGTFEVFHPLTEILCQLPLHWIVRQGATLSRNDRGSDGGGGKSSVSMRGAC